MFSTKLIEIDKLEGNKGQIKGLPKNPRIIRDSRFNALKKSISDSPEMLNLREVIVYDNDGKYVIIAGNMRFAACKDLGHKEVPCKILPHDTSVEKLKEYAIKDNVEFGQNDWASLVMDWDKEELVGYGFEDWTASEKVENVDKEETLQEKLDGITNDNCIYPIVPEFDERHELFIIVSDNKIDSNWLRERLGLNKMKSYKRDEVGKSNVIHIKDIHDVL